MDIIIEHSKCNGCGICVPACPSGAISLVEGFAELDLELCTFCLKCIYVCPTGAISTFEPLDTSNKITLRSHDDIEVIEGELIDLKEQTKKSILSDVGQKILPSLFRVISYALEHWVEGRAISKDRSMNNFTGSSTKSNAQRYQHRKREGRK